MIISSPFFAWILFAVKVLIEGGKRVSIKDFKIDESQIISNLLMGNSYVNSNITFNRGEEKNIKIEYIKRIHELHEEIYGETIKNNKYI